MRWRAVSTVYRCAWACIDTIIALIDWAKKEIENYAEVFRKQAFTPDVDQRVFKQAVKIAHAQSKKVCIVNRLIYVILIPMLAAARIRFRLFLSSQRFAYGRPQNSTQVRVQLF